jgi:DNA-binding IscR family transcriptional regulator
LARDPRKISTLEVIRAIDGPIVLADCFTEATYCDHAGRCTVRRPLRRIHEAILQLLESVSIQDLLEDGGESAHGALPNPLVALEGIPKTLEPAQLAKELTNV